MKQPHKHAALIKAWADGAEIQWYDSSPRENRWKDCPEFFDWDATALFRIKPEPKPDVVYYGTFDAIHVCIRNMLLDSCFTLEKDHFDQLKIVFDGETGKLKSAEVL